MKRLKAAQIKRLCNAHFDVVNDRSSPQELVIICPEPDCGDKSGNRSINLSTGQTNCWRCGNRKGHRGQFEAWVKKFGVKPDDEDDYVDAGQDIESAMSELTLAEKRATSYVHEVALPRGFTPLADEEGRAYWKLIKKMAEKKHLTIEDFVRAGVGFTREDPLWEPYAIFPIREWGRVVYYQGRLYGAPDPNSKVKGTKKFPSKKVLPNGSRFWVYNIDRVRAVKPKVVIVVEAILNVLSLENELKKRNLHREAVPVAIFKHAISPEQLKKLLSLRDVSEICLMFDPDALSDAWESAVDLSNQRHVTVVDLPPGTDPNDDAAMAVDRFLERKPVNPGNLLEAKLRFGL